MIVMNGYKNVWFDVLQRFSIPLYIGMIEMNQNFDLILEVTSIKISLICQLQTSYFSKPLIAWILIDLVSMNIASQ